MEEEKLRLLEEGIAKAYLILDGYPVNAVCSTEDCMKYYDCVYYLCCCVLGYDRKLLDRFRKALEESIVSKVLPSLVDKDGAPLLEKFLHLLTNYKTMTKFLREFFQYLDHHIVERKSGPLLSDISFCSFHELVCRVLHKKLTNATVFLINEDRDGVLIDWNLLQDISRFYVEVGEQGNIPHSGMFEEAILADAVVYYSRVASEWFMCHSSSTYVFRLRLD